MSNKCDVCLGEGLVHQGESISKVCSACSGSGSGEAAVVEVAEESAAE